MGISPDPHGLLVLDGGCRWGHDAHAGVVEDEGFDFAFSAVGRDFLAVKQESDSGGVPDLGDDFASATDRGVGRSDQGFLVDILAVGEDGDPGRFGGADHQSERGR